MKKKIKELLEESAALKQGLIENELDLIEQMAQVILEGYRHGKKLVIFGNGGSAADAQHLAAELVGRYARNRDPLPALALTTDTSLLTALGNDFGFNKIFSRQVEACVERGDVVLAISTSGNSTNIIEGILAAKKKGATVIGFTGGNGGKMKKEVDFCLCIPTKSTPRIQEMHITVGHILCGLVEEEFFTKCD
ncbi:MAG: D-sedoheptulose 7-phosphate isomerase [Elusimicrobiota bacterium]